MTTQLDEKIREMGNTARWMAIAHVGCFACSLFLFIFTKESEAAFFVLAIAFIIQTQANKLIDRSYMLKGYQRNANNSDY